MQGWQMWQCGVATASVLQWLLLHSEMVLVVIKYLKVIINQKWQQADAMLLEKVQMSEWWLWPQQQIKMLYEQQLTGQQQ